MNTQKVVGKVGKFNIGFRPERLTSHTGTVLLHDFAQRLVLPPSYHRATIKTLRRHLLNLAGKIVHTARRCFLMISDQYRSQAVWRFAITRLAHLQFG